MGYAFRRGRPILGRTATGNRARRYSRQLRRAFPGGTVLHWSAGANGRGALLSGDILQVTPDGFVSFMYSYPNLIPLPGSAVRGIAETLKPFSFDRIYGAWWKRVIKQNAKAVVGRSVERYLSSIGSLGG